MTILFYCNWPNRKRWINGIKKKFKGEKVEIWPNIKNIDDIKYAIVWDLPNGVLKKFVNLRIIFSLGAGVDHLLSDHQLPKIPIVRLKDPVMAKSMLDYVYAIVLNYQINIYRHIKNQKHNFWENNVSFLENKDIVIGILGLGFIGTYIAKKLYSKKYRVQGFKTKKNSKYIKYPVYYKKSHLKKFIVSSDIILNILPSTPQTKNFIDNNFLKKMKTNSLLINIGRGATINEKELITHMRKSRNFYAVLDVFKNEPLKKGNALWKLDNIIITPHIAGVTDIKSAINQIYSNYLLYKAKGKLKNTVNREKHY